MKKILSEKFTNIFSFSFVKNFAKKLFICLGSIMGDFKHRNKFTAICPSLKLAVALCVYLHWKAGQNGKNKFKEI